jgi:two-component system cell cycle response regulator
LVIEPSAAFQLVLSKLLDQHGFTVQTIRKGEDALDKIEHARFDLVCVAMQLPDMLGIDVCRRVRCMDETVQSIPVVMITAEHDKPTLVEALRSGATEIFNKKDISSITTYLDQFAWNNAERQALFGNILYVEDSRSVAAVTEALLTDLGMTVDHFTHAEDALASFHDNDYDMVITDVVLEGNMSGFQLVQKIRSDRSKSNIPILAISGVEDASRRISLLKEGANDYVAKPYMEEELIARIQNLLRSKKLLDRIQQQQEYMRELAMKDQLTGLYNRHFLMEVGPQKIRESHRHQHPLSVIVVDLDKFKSINDTYGHSTGDEVLEGVGSLLKGECRHEDLAARFGGEEFVLILSHCDQEHAVTKAEEIRQKIEALKPANLTVTASFGVATLLRHDDTDDLSKVFARADEAVYQSKENGRNQVTVSPA